MLCGTHSTLRKAVCNSALSLTSYLWLLQSTRNESLGISQIFPGHVHSPKCVYSLLRSQEYSDLFKPPPPPRTSHSPTFLLRVVLFCFVFYQILVCSIITTSGSCSVKQLLLIVFDKYSQGKVCSHLLRASPFSGSFQ